MCVLALDEDFFVQQLSKVIALPQSVDAIRASLSMSGWVEVYGYKLADNGQLLSPESTNSKEKWLGREGESPAKLQDIIFIDPEPTLRLRIYNNYIAYVCPFENDIKIESAGFDRPCRSFLEPTLDRGATVDRFLDALLDEGDDPHLYQAVAGMVNEWNYQSPGG